jgi:cytidine deaminase
LNSSEAVILAAEQVRANAYAPYSNYPVGAAFESDSGEIYSGANVENVSFGVTICAERAALCAMVSAGGRTWTRAAIVSVDGGTPCGACLQFMSEFVKDPATSEILVLDTSGNCRVLRMSDLLPQAFATFAVTRTER